MLYRATISKPVQCGRQRSQGGVQFLSGVVRSSLWEPTTARYTPMCARVSRSVAMPEPTVTVRMEEIEGCGPTRHLRRCVAVVVGIVADCLHGDAVRVRCASLMSQHDSVAQGE